MNTCVVGGGIVGALTAHALVRKGFEVQVLDAGEPGAATPASAGILFSIFDWTSDSIWAHLARHGHAAYPKLCAGVEAEVGYERRGLLSVGTDVQQVAGWAKSQGLACQVLTPRECRQRFPQIATPEHDVALLPEVAQINPRKFIKIFRRGLQDEGVHWDTARVSKVLQNQNRIRGVSDGVREWRAEQVVIAAGAWSSELQEGAGPESPIRPRRGQIVAWHSVETENLPIILDGHKYLLAREDGEILAGATDEDVGFDAGITEQARTELTDFARRWCPGLLMGEPDTQWAGLRPQGDESGPRVGAHDTVRGLFFNTGHYRHGIVCAPGTAERLVECCRP